MNCNIRRYMNLRIVENVFLIVTTGEIFVVQYFVSLF